MLSLATTYELVVNATFPSNEKKGEKEIEEEGSWEVKKKHCSMNKNNPSPRWCEPNTCCQCVFFFYYLDALFAVGQLFRRVSLNFAGNNPSSKHCAFSNTTARRSAKEVIGRTGSKWTAKIDVDQTTRRRNSCPKMKASPERRFFVGTKVPSWFYAWNFYTFIRQMIF